MMQNQVSIQPHDGVSDQGEGPVGEGPLHWFQASRQVGPPQQARNEEGQHDEEE